MSLQSDSKDPENLPESFNVDVKSGRDNRGLAMSADQSSPSSLGLNENLRASIIINYASTGSYPHQEDYLLADREKGVFIVADGFGGPTAGVQAAKTACEAIRNFLYKEAGDLDATLPFILRNYFSLAGNVLYNSVIHANRQVAKLNKEKNINEKGGASVIGGFIDGDLLALANVGSCTSWLLRDHGCLELVIPRTLAKLRDPLNVTPGKHLKAPLIALGLSEDLEPEIFEYKLKLEDWVILATDGVSVDLINKIHQIKLKKLKNPHVAVNEVIQNYAYEDNSSISIVIF